MKKTFEISINKIRKIMLRLSLKRKLIIALLVFMFGSFALFIYCLIIGYFVDAKSFHIAYTSLSFFIVILLSLIIRIYNYYFKRIPGKGKTIITYEYEFNDDNVVAKNLSRGTSFILNKKNIKSHCTILDVLVVVEYFCYFFPNDEEVKQNLGF